jgi:hypothetical protein
MSAENSRNDQPGAPGPAGPPGAAPLAGPAAPAAGNTGAASHAERRGVWAMDHIRTARSIGPLSAFASVGPRLRSRRRPLVVAGIAVLGLLGGAGAALATTGSRTAPPSASAVAANPSPSPTPTPAAGVPRWRSGQGARGFGAAGGMFGAAGGMFGTVHGQIVVARPSGGYETVDIQTGQVTAVSATSITLKSADGFAHAYAITGSTMVDAQRDGIGSVKVGNQVSLSATVAASTATAVSIQDITLIQQGRQAFSHPGSAS